MSGDGIVVVKEAKKERALIGRLFRLVMFFVAVYGVVTAIARVMLRLANRLEEGNEGNDEKRYLNFMNGRNIRFDGEEISSVEVNAVAGGVELDLTEAELMEDAEVCVRALMSGVVVKVPPMVRVEVDDTDVLSGFMNLVPKYEMEDLPVLRIKVQSMLSGVKVEMKAE